MSAIRRYDWGCQSPLWVGSCPKRLPVIDCFWSAVGAAIREIDVTLLAVRRLGRKSGMDRSFWADLSQQRCIAGSQFSPLRTFDFEVKNSVASTEW